MRGLHLPGLGFMTPDFGGGEAPPPVESQQLFTDGEMTGLSNAGDNSGYNLGAKFQFAVEGTILAVKFGKPLGASQSFRRCGVYSAAGALLREGIRGEMAAEPAAGQVVEISLDEPLEVDAATTYVVQVTVAPGGTGGYAAQANGFASAVTEGDITALADAASGGNGVFNDSSGATLQFANTDGSANYWVTPVFIPGPPPELPSGYPTSSNTGASGTLTPYGGSLTITVDDTVIENHTVAGAFIVQAARVIIRNCEITYTDAYGVDGDNVATIDLTVEDCTITGPGAAGSVNAGILGQGTFRRNKISGSENGIVLGAGVSLVEDNYIFDLLTNSGDPHVDGISLQGGQTSTIVRHNTVIAYDTSCIFLKNDFGAVTDCVIEDNLLLPDPTFGGPSSMISLIGATVTGTEVIDNKIARAGPAYYSEDATTAALVSGNVNAYTGVPL